MISPGLSCCEHTLNTLRYADRYVMYVYRIIGLFPGDDLYWLLYLLMTIIKKSCQNQYCISKNIGKFSESMAKHQNFLPQIYERFYIRILFVEAIHPIFPPNNSNSWICQCFLLYGVNRVRYRLQDIMSKVSLYHNASLLESIKSPSILYDYKLTEWNKT